MIYTELTKKALKIAYNAHKHQVDKTGLPYIYHPLHLAYQLETEDEITLALLHDVIEDSHYTFEDLIQSGIPDHIIEALTYLTHDNNMTYEDYIHRISENSLSVRVKLADLKHNSDLSRLDHITDKDLQRQKKYLDAIEYLNQYINNND